MVAEVSRAQALNELDVPLTAIPIREPWVSHIVVLGDKDWELRGSRILHRGAIGIVASGTGTVVAVVDVVDCHGPLSLLTFQENEHRHQVKNLTALPYTKTYAYELQNVRQLNTPVPYIHKSGAVTRVRLNPEAVWRIREQLEREEYFFVNPSLRS